MSHTPRAYRYLRAWGTVLTLIVSLVFSSSAALAQSTVACDNSVTFTNIYGVVNTYFLFVRDSSNAVVWSRSFELANSNATTTLSLGDQAFDPLPGQIYTISVQVSGPGVCCGAFTNFTMTLSGQYEFLGTPPGCGQGTCRTVSDFVPPGSLTGKTYQFQRAASVAGACPELVDPIEYLSQLYSPRPVPDLSSLATLGRIVEGLTADGVTRVAVRIPATGPGDNITLRVFRDPNTPSDSVPLYGGVGAALGGDNFTDELLQPLTVTETFPGSNTYVALAVYRSPADFVKEFNCVLPSPCATATKRTVYVEVTRNGAAYLFPIIIARPPVVMVHGINSNKNEWNNFPWPVDVATLFTLYKANYGNYASGVTSFLPAYNIPNFFIKNSYLGFEYNARTVSAFIEESIRSYRVAANNLTRREIAVVQADIVAHSMGGLVTRMIPRAGLNTFKHPGNYQAGTIHKVITLGTPHFATPNGRQVLLPENDCIASTFAALGPMFLRSAVVNGTVVNGGAFDLGQGDNADPNPSPIWTTLRAPGAVSLHIAPLAGEATEAQYQAMMGTTIRGFFRLACSGQLLFPTPDNLITNYDPAGWRVLLRGESDGVVPLGSGLAGQESRPFTFVPFSQANTFPVTHSSGVTSLGLGGPTLHDSGPVAHRVMDLLNTPREDSPYLVFP